MKNLIKSLAARLGYEFRKIDDAPQIQAHGVIVSWPHRGQEVRFHLENRFDLIGRDLFNGRFFEEEELTHLASLVRPGGTCVDIGANIGNHSVFFGKILGAAKVIAVEPGDWGYPRLCFNLALNGLTGCSVTHKLALSDRAGRARMDFWAPGNHGTLAIHDGAGGEEVTLVTGDSLLEGEDVALIKIDAERHEDHVLRGLEATLARCRPVLLLEAAQTDRAATEARLAALGYRTDRAFERYGDIVNLIAVAD